MDYGSTDETIALDPVGDAPCSPCPCSLQFLADSIHNLLVALPPTMALNLQKLRQNWFSFLFPLFFFSFLCLLPVLDLLPALVNTGTPAMKVLKSR